MRERNSKVKRKDRGKRSRQLLNVVPRPLNLEQLSQLRLRRSRSSTDQPVAGAETQETGSLMKAASTTFRKSAKGGAPSCLLLVRVSRDEGWATLYNRVGVVKRHVDRRRFFGFSLRGGVAFGFVFAHCTKARFQNPAVEPGSTNHLSGHLFPIMIRCSDSSTTRGGKVPNQPNDDLRAHQGGPRAVLHANQLRVAGLAAQHPVHPYCQLSGDRDLRHTPAPAQLQSLIVLP
jgi:hypothetical protein